MKFAQTTLIAILASCAFVNAAPVAQMTETSMVKRADVNEVMNLLSELESIHKKRDLATGEFEFNELSKRADSVIGDLISALANSGIIGDVWNTLTTDQAIQSSLGAIIKSAVQAAVVNGPALLSAIWNSGLIGKLFNTLVNDQDVRSALINAAKALITDAIGLLTPSSSSNTQAAAPAAPAATPAAAQAKRELSEILASSDDDFLSKRDLGDTIISIVDAIKNSGIVQSLIQKVLANPQQTISFLTSAIKNGVVLVEDLYSWAKSSGLLNSIIGLLTKNGGPYTSALASFLGNQVQSGNISPAEISSATGAATTTTVATTAAAAPAAATAATAAPAATAGASAGSSSNSNSNSVYAQLAAEYGHKRRNY